MIEYEFVENPLQSTIASVPVPCHLQNAIFLGVTMIKHKKIVFLAVFLFLLAAVFYGDRTLQTEEFSFLSSALPDDFDGFRIVHLSDLHGRQFGKGNKKLLAAVRNAAPDIIALTGDFVDANCNSADLEELICGLVEIAPTYYVTGNHEWGAGKALETVSAFTSWGVNCLQNEFVTLYRGDSSIVLAGIHDPNGYADQKTPEQLSQEVEEAYPNSFWILLAHRNNLFSGRYCRLGADLTLCGHAHGGIWRIPGTDGLIDTTMTFLPSFTSGFYSCIDENCSRSTVFVSRGLGDSPRFVPRLFNRPQVAVIILEKEQA